MAFASVQALKPPSRRHPRLRGDDAVGGAGRNRAGGGAPTTLPARGWRFEGGGVVDR